MFEAAVQALLKLIVLVGIVVVGGMFFHLYGSEIGVESALLDRIVHDLRVEIQQFQGPQSAPTAAAVMPAPTLISSDLTMPAPASLPVAALAPASNLSAEPMAPLAPLPELREPTSQAVPASVQQLVAELRELGAEDIQLTPWGAEGAYHRFACCAPVPGDSGFVRHFDAIEPDAQLAVTRVFDQVRQWRGAHPALRR